jgi:pilus assembly protein FimV
MSPRLYPLTLLLAIAGADAAHALGLGELRLDSALNEPLAGRIDILSATPEELTSLTAAVARRETFQSYGFERPAFLSSTTFKLIRDEQGRPALAVRSTEPFTEPFVNLLIDVRWPGGELVREYPLLLDPAVYPGTRREADSGRALDSSRATEPSPEAASAAPAAMSAGPSAGSLPGASSPLPGAATITAAAGPYTVAASDTLVRIAHRLGARAGNLERMMIAIFRANPGAFDGNINRLHRGAALTIPSAAALAAISADEANRELKEQMAAWHANRAPGAVAVAGAVSSAPTATRPTATSTASASASSPPAAPTPSATSDTDALTQRLASLEQSLYQMKALVRQQDAEVLRLRASATQTVSNTAPSSVQPPEGNAVPASNGKAASAQPGWVRALSIGSALALLAFVLALLRRRQVENRYPPLRYPLLEKYGAADEGVQRQSAVVSTAVVSEAATPTAMQPAQRGPVTAPANRAPATHADGGHETDREELTLATREMPAHPGMAQATETDSTARLPSVGDTTISLAVDAIDMDDTLVDFESIETHVQMPSALKEHAVVAERRTNFADVLKGAIEREPDRRDLSLKLLELYHDAAATNRRAFLDIARTLANDRDGASAEEWDRVESMARQIAADDELLTSEGAPRK